MEKAKRYFHIFMNILEIYIPSVAIVVLFTSFILQIFSRYILNAPMIWPYEMAQVSYVCAIMLGTCYAERKQENIMFTVLYDALPPMICKLFDLLSNFMVVLFFAISLPSVMDFYTFFMTRYSTVLKIPLGLVYFPYFPFMLITTVRFARRFIYTLKTPAAKLSAKNNPRNEEELI